MPALSALHDSTARKMTSITEKRQYHKVCVGVSFDSSVAGGELASYAADGVRFQWEKGKKQGICNMALSINKSVSQYPR